MARILVVYGTSYGQTAKIVTRMAERLTHEGCQVTVWRGDLPSLEPSLGDFDACVVAGSVIYGRYQSYLRRFVREHVARLNQMPSAFVSVCGALAGTWEKGPARAREYMEDFLTATGWRPALTRSFAGGLPYTRYGFITRWLMKAMSKHAGRPTDTTRDWEFTDWAEVDRFTWAVAASVAVPAAAGK